MGIYGFFHPQESLGVAPINTMGNEMVKVGVKKAYPRKFLAFHLRWHHLCVLPQMVIKPPMLTAKNLFD